MEVKFRISTTIRRPLCEVFEAVVNPDILSCYFVKSSSGRIEAGKTMTWNFHTYSGDLKVMVIECVNDERIVFEWMCSAGYFTRVTMEFKLIRGASLTGPWRRPLPVSL